MSKATTRADINANITSNGSQSITGAKLNTILNEIVDDYAMQTDMDTVKAALEITLSVSATGAGTKAFAFKAGHSYKVVNTGAEVTLTTRATSSGSTVESIGTIASGATKTFNCTIDASYLRYGSACTCTITDQGTLTARMSTAESSISTLKTDVSANAKLMSSVLTGTSAAGGKQFAYKFVVGHRYKITNTGNVNCNFSTRLTSSGETVETIGEIWKGGDSLVFVPALAANYLRVAQNTTFRIEDLTLIEPAVARLQEDIEPSLVEPMVRFDIGHELRDVSADLSGINFRAQDALGCYTLIEQVYARFDALVTAHSGVITRVDAAEQVSLTYPDYASLGGSASGDYDATPTYKTYMYKVVSSNSAVNKAATDMRKRKLLIVAGTHGNELAAPFNCYLFAKWLVEASDLNAFKMRSAFDVYIVPCLNGYGMYHRQRPNANGVDINRNYPVHRWSEQNVGTEEWTGSSAGSEFETQLVMALTASIKPDLAVDHHNYDHLTRQFYTDGWGQDVDKIAHQALVDCSYTFVKELPTYFGNEYRLFMSSGNLPGTEGSKTGLTPRYWYENGVRCPLTIEVSMYINYYGGVYDTARDEYGSHTFAIADYTLRMQLMRFGEYALQRVKEYSY